ncbi:Methyltransferase type 11 [Chlorobium limicola DSM 245]|uniref:Methyltransferase type 11 n=1 Tax=Chlorobium limicola (strain DSM 245 / NBRC 103803 / 6330) TaxID=290315 RepID=B3EHA9_CHLL2|nr:class I SAM-dependent methyltransferase [Chlorobium limicola]ACD91271.1 Methyltransferase type 11 [Chlorobium limicola DSM 245]
MRNPWLDIPLADYESHMSMPAIDQADMLAAQFSDALLRFSPEAVAVIGCAGGNGFDKIDPAVTRRVVGVDINPGYIVAASSRFEGSVPGLEFHVADIQSDPLAFEPVDLVYAALVFEYVSLPESLGRLSGACRPGGRLVTVLQMPSQDIHAVSPSPYRSIQALVPCMRLVSPEEFAGRAATAGFLLESGKTLALGSGKQFAVQMYRRADG